MLSLSLPPSHVLRSFFRCATPTPTSPNNDFNEAGEIPEKAQGLYHILTSKKGSVHQASLFSTNLQCPFLGSKDHRSLSYFLGDCSVQDTKNKGLASTQRTKFCHDMPLPESATKGRKLCHFLHTHSVALRLWYKHCILYIFLNVQQCSTCLNDRVFYCNTSQTSRPFTVGFTYRNLETSRKSHCL